MFFKVKLTRLETGGVWCSPYVYINKKAAQKAAAWWQGNIWKAVLIRFKYKPKGEIPPQDLSRKNKPKSAKTKVAEYLEKA
jgi:hypothetical protein